VTTPLPVLAADRCWQQIGVWGDRSCPELRAVTHCHNCPVFAAAGRLFLDAPPPPEYPAEWAERLAAPVEEDGGGLLGVLVFRLGDEWLGLPVGVLVEVTHPRPVHRVPHRGGLLAGLVNIRGELQLSVRLDRLLGTESGTATGPEATPSNPRFVVIRRDADGWVFPADEVDQVRRWPGRDLRPAPPTLSRATAHLVRGMFHLDGRTVGVLDEARLFQALRERVR
jgi:chemotaxis-related protein WspD